MPKKEGDRCEPAASVIDKFGGVRKLAKLLNTDPSTISRWQQLANGGRVSRGLDGLIPARYHWTLLTMARARGIKLTAEELIRHE